MAAAPREVHERVGRAEREHPFGSQHARHLRKRALGIAEAHRAVVAEHDVERVRRERQRLAARVHERHRRALLGTVRLCMAQLAGREVEAGGAGTGARERGRPLRRAAAELQHVLVADVAQHAELRLRAAPRAPRERAGREVGAVHLLVHVRVRIPELPVPGDVVARRGLRHGDDESRSRRYDPGGRRYPRLRVGV